MGCIPFFVRAPPIVIITIDIISIVAYTLDKAREKAGCKEKEQGQEEDGEDGPRPTS